MKSEPITLSTPSCPLQETIKSNISPTTNNAEEFCDSNFVVNDHHSELNRTVVGAVRKPLNENELVMLVREARETNRQICIAGGRHAMGGQQFKTNAMLIDTASMNSVLNFDSASGKIEVEAGIMWPDLIEYLQTAQTSSARPWTISQKQTGCDLLTIGGALASNVHGRGLNKAPIVEDVEEFRIVLADGTVERCSRIENSELFCLAIGGYGAFGIISTVTLRLVPQQHLRRSVSVCSTSDAVSLLELSKSSGATFGDFQFAIDDASVDFLRVGILSTYTAEHDAKATTNRKLLDERQWEELLYLAHCDKSVAFEKYTQHYLSTNGQIYCSDTFQSATYLSGYHRRLDEKLGAECKGSEAITEVYVPRNLLADFMSDASVQLKEDKANVIYGTVRLINRDDETFLPWASSDWACIVFNLHVDHTSVAISDLEKTFRNLYDLAIKYGGKYYLTYNKFATPQQLLRCYPQALEFLEFKRLYDPDSRFTSNWLEYLSECVSARSDDHSSSNWSDMMRGQQTVPDVN
ncbi:MAG TPA: FAD-binding oxidoreductase [Drouetiella sp.]